MPIPSPADFRNKTKKHSEVREMLAQMAEVVASKDYVSKTGFAKIAGNSIANFNYDTVTRTLTFSNTVHITTCTTRVQLTTPQSVVLGQNTIYRLDYNIETGEIKAQGYTQNRFESWVPFAFVRAFSDKIETTDFQYAINGVAFDAVKIATDTSSIDATNKVKALEDSLVVKSSNLYDASAANTGYLIDAEGVSVANAVHCHSDFIKVEPNQKYTAKAWANYLNARIRGFNAIAYYDVNKNFISRVFYDDTAVSADGVGVFTTLSNAKYIRLNMQDTNPARYSRQINKGVADIPFEPYRIQLSGIALAPDVLHQIGSELQIEKSDGIMFDLPVDGVFNTDQVWDMYTGWRGGATRANDVYAMFDSLQASHPNYISKQVLGQDDYGYTISCYKFIPQRPSTTVTTKRAKIFITTGTHGYEHVPPLAMYLLLEQMCNNWQSDPLLEVLRYNVDLLIIPVVNPSGFDDYTRKNRNGVDINRNFPQNFGWQSTDPASPYYGGVEPLDQKESQYIVQVFNENPDINIMYDFHNFHGTSEETRYIWVADSGKSYTQHMAQILIQRMTRKWRNELTWLPPEETYFVGNASGVDGAQIKSYARSRGVRFAATFEVCEKWWVGSGVTGTYDATHCKTAVEAIANWLLINLNELQKT